MLAALLTICAISAPSEPPTAIATAPKLPPWPAELSAPTEGPDGTLLPPDLAEATNARLRACQALPGRYKARLDALWSTCDAMVSGARLVERADCLGARVEDGDGGGITAWQALVGGVVIAVLSGGAMYLAGRQDR